MPKKYSNYLLKEQSGNLDMVRAQAAQSGVDFDKLPPEIQNRLGSIASSWQQNQQAYQDLASREASINSQINLLSNQPMTPETQQTLAQLQNQLQSTRSGLDQVKSGMAELEAAGKEIEPAVTQMRDSGQAAAPVQPPTEGDIQPPVGIGSDIKSGIGSAVDSGKEAIGTARDYWAKELPPSIEAGKQMVGTARDYWDDKAGPGGVEQWTKDRLDTAKDYWTPKLQDKMKPQGFEDHGWEQNQFPSDAPLPPQTGGEFQAPPVTAAQPVTPTPPPTIQPLMTHSTAPQDPSLIQQAGDMATQYGPEAAAAGAAGAAVLGAYKLYKQFFSKSARACKDAPDKSECMQQYRTQGVQAAINSLKRQAPNCGNDQNCVQKIKSAISRLEGQLGS